MGKKIGFFIILVILLVSVSYVYFVPKAKYTGKGITADILDSIPVTGQQWQGEQIEDVGNELEGEIYNFISRIFAAHYVNSSVANQFALLIVLDAGNFHYPKVCFQGGGFVSEELPQRELNLEQGKLKAHILLHQKKGESLLSIYWICIDKEIVSTWTEQKLRQLFYSLFNKERVGLMVRVDVPLRGEIDSSVKIAEDFLNDIYQAFPSRYRDYIFSDFGQNMENKGRR